MPVILSRSLLRIRSRLAAEDGFTMLLAMVMLLVVVGLSAAALTASSDDAHLNANDLNQKQAYLAAQAGISDYEFHLNQDVNYWSYCTNVPTPNAVNQQGSTANRLSVPGSSTESYAIELLPATGQTTCDPTNSATTMIESTGTAAGTFRIRADGFSGNVERSIVATFRRKSFVDFVYYTVYETLDPSAYSSQSDRTAAAQTCDVYWRNHRPPPTRDQNYCSQIFFATGDVVNGPLHTEDELAVCGSPTFGRNSNDVIEVVAPPVQGDPGYSTQGNYGCSNSPVFKGTFVAGADSIQPPPNNAQLQQLAASNYQWTGQTHITLNSNNTITVTNNGTTTTMPYPSNGVIYVSSSSCAESYTPFNVTYPGPSGCGTVTVDGNYSQSLTIGSDNDVLIDGNLTAANNNALLGLIAQNFVRVYHPCTNGYNGSGSISNLNIQAALLALTGSFIVDNYSCGSALGNLNVTGAIAQIYRGPVATGGTYGISSGYSKNYVYDDRLREQEPPHFLNPIQAAWHVLRETECTAGTTSCP